MSLIHHQIIPVHIVVYRIWNASDIGSMALAEDHSVSVDHGVASLVRSRYVRVLPLFLLLLLLVILLLGLRRSRPTVLIPSTIAISLLLIALLVIGLAVGFNVLVVGVLDQTGDRLRVIDNEVIYIIVINNVCNVGWCLVPLRRRLAYGIGFSLGNILRILIFLFIIYCVILINVYNGFSNWLCDEIVASLENALFFVCAVF